MAMLKPSYMSLFDDLMQIPLLPGLRLSPAQQQRPAKIPRHLMPPQAANSSLSPLQMASTPELEAGMAS